jgi:hypothetical protein
MIADYATRIVDDWGVPAARIPAVAVALVVCAWFAISLHQAIDTDAASAIIYGQTVPNAQQAADAGSLLSSASTLNPDTGVQLLRSTLAYERGDDARARQLALAVTRQEPLNLQAWLTFGRASSGDPQAFHLALTHVDELAPALNQPR